MKERLSSWFRPSTFAVAVGALLLVVALAHPLPSGWRFAAEAGVYLLLGLACASAPAVRRVVAAMGVYRLAVLAPVFLFAAGIQLTKSYGPFYPFVRWTMYGSANPGHYYPVFEASFASGRTGPVPFTELTPSRSPRAFLTHFSRQLRRMHDAGGDDPEARRELGRLLAHVVGIYNETNPADPIVAVRAGGCAVDIHDYAGPESPRCEFIEPFTFAAEPGR